MTTASARRLARIAAATALLASAGVLAWAWLAPLPMPMDDGAQKHATNAPASQPSRTPPLTSFAAAWSRDLRRPLDDAAGPTAPVVAETAAHVLPVRLVGTIIDPARPRGIFMTQLGQMELRGVGEKAGGMEILRIDERSATVSVAGQPVVLKIEKAEFIVPGVNPSARVSDKPTSP